MGIFDLTVKQSTSFNASIYMVTSASSETIQSSALFKSRRTFVCLLKTQGEMEIHALPILSSLPNSLKLFVAERRRCISLVLSLEVQTDAPMRPLPIGINFS